MKSILAISLFILSATGSLLAQYVHFTKKGVITYEKTVNMHALLREALENDKQGFFADLYNDYIKSKPQFKKMTSSLSFNDDQMLYTPADGFKFNYRDHPMATQPNTILTNLSLGTTTIQKRLYEEFFWMKDSVRNINWKITDEFREIAGYFCRRANAVILDSIYVVAFYTDEIAVSGGPESFSGLPGMILGVALPHEHVTWFATLVMEIPVDPATLTLPLKGKQLNQQSLRETIKSAFDNYEPYPGAALKAFTL